MHQTKAIFFDLYQTLIDVDAKKENEGRKTGFEKVIIPYLLQKGISKSEASLAPSYYSDELQAFYKERDIELFQHSFPVILSKIFSRNYNLPISEAEINDLVYEFRKMSRGYLRLYEGVREALEALSGHYTLAIASHTQGIYTERELGELDILRYFKYRIYSSEIGFKKKSNNFYQKCLEVVGLNPKDCAMVGDNLYEDMYMANQNGIHTIWIINPLTKDKNEKGVFKPEANLPIKSIRHLPNIMMKILG